MDVRCEKCQTEYELDEARLKPGGVTVKCTNCGHMFKIRKRSPTNVGAAPGEQRPRTQSSKPPGGPLKRPERPDSIFDEAPTTRAEDGPTTLDRQWLIRLENGDQKSCRELATLQQWIVAAVVSRESLISRSGKTWKRLGDIAELAQFFDIADEARTTRDVRRASPTGRSPTKDVPGTMLGVGAPTAAGGTILPDDEDDVERRTTGSFSSQPARRPPTQPPPLPGKITSAKTPPMGSNASASPVAPLPRRPLTQPPPPPPKKTTSQSGPLPQPPQPTGNRATATWATDGIAPGATNSTQARPFGGKLAAIPDEPAFAAGRVRANPSDEASFDTGRVRNFSDDDDDDLLPKSRGSRTGIIILVMVLLVGASSAAVIYFFVMKKDKEFVKAVDAPAMVAMTPDAAAILTPIIDAPPAPPPLTPAEAAKTELAADNEARLRTAIDSLAGKDEPAALAVRANLGVAIAQALVDSSRARREVRGRQAAQGSEDGRDRSGHRGAARVQSCTPMTRLRAWRWQACFACRTSRAKDIKRYLDAAKAKPGDWARDVALGEALVLKRDGKLDDAKAAFTAIDQGDGKLETSNDVRARFQLALLALAQNRAAEAKPLVEQVLAAQADHAAARALSAKLDTLVAKTDPLPPEDGNRGSGSSRAADPESRCLHQRRLRRAAQARRRARRHQLREGERAVSEGARAEAEWRRSAHRPRLLPHQREAVRERAFAVSHRARDVAALRAGACGNRRGVPATGSPGKTRSPRGARISRRIPVTRRG